MRRGALVWIGLALLITGCAGESKPPTPPAPPPVIETPPIKAPEAPPPVRSEPVRTSLVRSITVDGTLVEAKMIEVPPEPTEVVVQFTAPMGKAWVEERLLDLPEGSKPEWTAPDRLTIHVPAGRSFTLYFGETVTADGTAVDDGQRTLYVSRVTPTRFRLFQPTELLAGGAPLLTGSLPIPEGAAFSFSPDRKQVISYPGDPWAPSTPVYLIDLVSGSRTRLETPKADRFYCWAGWGPTGDLLLLDREALLRLQVRTFTPWTEQEGFCWTNRRSPTGRYVAVWGPFHLTLIDLASGIGVALPDEFKPVAQDGAVLPHWSPEGDQVAIGNAAQSGVWGGPIEMVILNLRGEVVRKLPGWWPFAWLPDGDLVVGRPVPNGEWERARLTREGDPSPRPVPPSGEFSPDGRWVIPYARGTKQVIELETGRQAVLPDHVSAQWLPDSTLLLVDQ